MKQPPVIDLLYRALVSGDHSELKQVSTTRAHEAAAVSALVSTDHEGGVDLDLGLGLSGNEFVTPLFEGPRARVVDVSTIQAARLNPAGRSGVLLDYSLGFDSNFAEKFRAVLNREVTHLRLMERLATVQRPGVSFLIPFFVSLDRRRRALLRLNPVRFMLVDRAQHSALCGRTHEVAFQDLLGKSLSPLTRGEMTPEKVSARRRVAGQLDLGRLRQLVAVEEGKLTAAR